jgi:hypothetical protein
MPIPPRIYDIPKMASFKGKDEAVILPTLSDYLDSLEPDNYCRHHDMYRPCHWCD